MTIAKRLVNTFAGILLIVSIVYAQEQQNNANSGRSAATITASAAADRVRFTAPSSVVQIRLEVYNANSEKLFDNEIRGGNVIDWHLLNGQGERLLDGTYLCVITSKSLSGRLSQKLGKITIENAAVSVQPVDTGQLTAQQSQVVGPVEENASLTVVKEDETQTATVIAHNGTEGQLIRGQGALSFRLGDFFAGKDIEQMRLTPEGNLGIGITHPQVRLDVDGVIRASQGIVFPDGTTQFSAASKTLGAKSTRPDQNTGSTGSKGEFQTQAAGTGTQNFIAKWTDNLGNLGNSIIFETSNNVGIGTTSPQNALDANGSLLLRGNSTMSNPSSVGPAFSAGYYTPGSYAFFQGYNYTTSTYIQLDIDASKAIINANSGGNVGIGTSSPLGKLQLVSANDTNPSTITAWDFRHLVIGAAGTAGGIGISYNQTNNAGFIQAMRPNVAWGNLILQSGGGNVGIGTTNPQAKLDVAGDIMVAGNAVIAGNIAAKYQDVAEWVPARTNIPPATVVSLDLTRTNTVTPSSRAYDSHIAGIVSAKPGLILGEAGLNKVMVATTGRVRVKVDATRHPIKIGDLLVTSHKPGVAMKSQPIRIAGKLIHRPGTIIGKALEPLATGQGEILVLLSLQ